MRKRTSRATGQVYAVTGLPASLQDERRGRMRRYLLSMGIRTACFILAVIALGVLHWTVVGWIFVIGAVILPYIAVVVANAKRPRGTTDLGPVTQSNITDSTITDSTMTPNRGATQQIAPRRPDEEPQP